MKFRDDPRVMKFWGVPNWHALGLPTLEELRAENRRLSLFAEMKALLPRPKIKGGE